MRISLFCLSFKQNQQPLEARHRPQDKHTKQNSAYQAESAFSRGPTLAPRYTYQLATPVRPRATSPRCAMRAAADAGVRAAAAAARACSGAAIAARTCAAAPGRWQPEPPLNQVGWKLINQSVLNAQGQPPVQSDEGNECQTQSKAPLCSNNGGGGGRHAAESVPTRHGGPGPR
jgi:hypothetical protein